MSCTFCNIVSGEIRAHKVYEDDFSLAFLDPYPTTEGHILIIPKKHIEKFIDMEPDEAAALFASANRIVKGVVEELSVPGFNIGINNGRVAGQVVPHVHIHLIPRKENDGGGGMRSILWTDPDTSNLEELAGKIREHFK